MSRKGSHPVGDLKDRFMRRVVIDDNGCWIWQGGKGNTGYGLFTYRENGKLITRLTHRLSYELFKGELGKRNLVCHSCDVKLCCNPDHLSLGTHSYNMQDMIKKGRSPRKGEKARFVKLTWEKVDEIRKVVSMAKRGHVFPTIREMAKKHQVNERTVRDIIDGRTWKIEETA